MERERVQKREVSRARAILIVIRDEPCAECEGRRCKKKAVKSHVGNRSVSVFQIARRHELAGVESGE